MSERTLYRFALPKPNDGNSDSVNEFIAGLPDFIDELVEAGWLVEVDDLIAAIPNGTEVCVVHWQAAIEGREFCPAGTETDIGGWYEWDCEVRCVGRNHR